MALTLDRWRRRINTMLLMRDLSFPTSRNDRLSLSAFRISNVSGGSRE
jgi:hypothetical protein